MTDRPDNPAAFPQHPSQMIGSERTWGAPGMDLRDWFAGQALSSIMQERAIWDSTPEEEIQLAGRMYRWADAMLAYREAK